MEGFSYSVSDQILAGITRPIRSTADAVGVILNVARYMQAAVPSVLADPASNLFVVTDPSSRILVGRGGGFLSLSFPFSAKREAEGVVIWCPQLGLRLDSRTIHFVQRFLDGFFSDDVRGVISELEEDTPDYLDFVMMAVHLLNSDHGYFRMDCDRDNENGKIHPLNHFDFFYANYSAVKVGIDSLWKFSEIGSLINAGVERPFLSF